MPNIATLPAEVVHAIAAGEVIDSLAAVVRELAENALDAGASRIAISVDPQQWFVSVADNGCGMNRQDLQQAASPHSTSKIQDFNDLHQITSLGFRGEALHSLAQLAQLKIYSRQGDDPRLASSLQPRRRDKNPHPPPRSPPEPSSKSITSSSIGPNDETPSPAPPNNCGPSNRSCKTWPYAIPTSPGKSAKATNPGLVSPQVPVPGKFCPNCCGVSLATMSITAATPP